MMTVETSRLAGANRHAEAIAAGDSASAVFRALLDAVTEVAPRGSIFLIRQQRLKGWGSVGYSPDVAQRFRAASAPLAAAGLDSVLGDGPGVLQFGQPVAADSRSEVLRVRGRPIALLFAERNADETPWLPDVLGLLARIAELRLALILADKKARAGTAAVAPEATPQPQAPAPVVPDTRVAEIDAAVGEATMLTPVDEPAAGVPEDAPELEAARRYARLVATDIRLYNEEAVALGRQHADLIDRLREQISRGKETFLRRHADLGAPAMNVLRDEFVQVLAGGNDSLLPRSVLE